MKSYRDITSDLEEYLGRRLTNEELDWCYICHICGSWGFFSYFAEGTYLPFNELQSGDKQGMLEGMDVRCSVRNDPDGARPTTAGDYRYIASPGNPVCWSLIREAEANRVMGVLLVPERVDKEGRICCAQFTGRKNKRIWITIQQAESIVIDRVRGMSFLSAVDKNI